MSHLTGDTIWDIFVIYIFGSIGFLFSCCLILACLFVFSPADDRSGLKRRSTSRNRQASAAKRSTIHRMEQKYDTVVELAHSKSTRAQSLLWECCSQKTMQDENLRENEKRQIKWTNDAGRLSYSENITRKYKISKNSINF